MPAGNAGRTGRFEAVALPHLSAAYNLARWLCRNEADAADVVQEALMRALQYFDSYHGGDARAWLLQIVRNSAYTWIESNRPAGRVPLDGDELDAAMLAAQPMNPFTVQASAGGEAASDAVALRRAIAQLPPEQREVLILREFEDLSYRQIAEVTGSPIGTVMSRLSRARDQLAAIVRGGPVVPASPIMSASPNGPASRGLAGGAIEPGSRTVPS
jgi:RNA polymerase sigma-70 factor (ECF subfamily)